MKRTIVGMLIGLILGSAAILWAKSESASSDAESVVGYGSFSGALVAIKVDADGVLQTN